MQELKIEQLESASDVQLQEQLESASDVQSPPGLGEVPVQIDCTDEKKRGHDGKTAEEHKAKSPRTAAKVATPRTSSPSSIQTHPKPGAPRTSGFSRIEAPPKAGAGSAAGSRASSAHSSQKSKTTSPISAHPKAANSTISKPASSKPEITYLPLSVQPLNYLFVVGCLTYLHTLPVLSIPTHFKTFQIMQQRKFVPIPPDIVVAGGGASKDPGVLQSPSQCWRKKDPQALEGEAGVEEDMEALAKRMIDEQRMLDEVASERAAEEKQSITYLPL